MSQSKKSEAETQAIRSNLEREIQRAKHYAEQPEQTKLARFEIQFRGDHGIYTVTYDNGEWTCTCHFFDKWGDCSHTMAAQRVLDTMLHKERQVHPRGTDPLPIRTEESTPAYPPSLSTSIQSSPGAADQRLSSELPTPARSSIAQTEQDNTTIVRIRITEEPLTPQNLLTILSALTDLYTKCWLIAKGRFADAITFTQTHDSQFTEEAGLTITKVTFNSPFTMDLKLDLSAPSVAQALVTAIDGVTQTRQRLEKAELENQAKQQELKHTAQKADDESQATLLEREKQMLDLERQRLEILEKRLEVQKRGIEYAIEIACKMVDLLHPSIDVETRAMLIQTLLPNLLQLQNGKGLELALSGSEEENKKDEAIKSN